MMSLCPREDCSFLPRHTEWEVIPATGEWSGPPPVPVPGAWPCRVLSRGPAALAAPPPPAGRCYTRVLVYLALGLPQLLRLSEGLQLSFSAFSSLQIQQVL